jgi:glycosyltransferase involved in cell wall biosynthesis
MPRVVWSTIATGDPMGQQRYETEIQAAIRRVAGAEWSFEAVTVASARSSMVGAKRFSTRLNRSLPLPASRLAGRYLYGDPELVHRFDLRLPAAYGCEVVTIHDLPPMRFRDEGELTRAALPGARKATRVIVPSAFARDEMAELIDLQECVIIPHGVSDDYALSQPATDEALQRRGIRTPFLLHAAGAGERKNLAGLADAWRRLSTLHPDLTLVMAGTADQRRDRAFAGLPRTLKVGRLESPELATLMRRAAVVVVPSTYEGFGLPALEGMACGVPVVAARRGALPEVCGDAGVLVEPDGASLAEGVDRVLTDDALAGDLRQLGAKRAAEFDWDVAGRAHLRVYAEALG